MNAQKKFGQRIKELRKQKKLTQEQLSEKLGLFQKQIGNIETGTTFTTMANIEKIADLLEVDISELFDFEHHQSRKEIIDKLNKIIDRVSDEKLRLIYRIVKDITK
jgi:transcriptional regulator with XRE-family HTH domain